MSPEKDKKIIEENFLDNAYKPAVISYLSNNGIEVKVFLDSSSIISMGKGYRDYLNATQPDNKKLDKEQGKLLVQALIFNTIDTGEQGYSVSIPHQHELIRKYKEILNNNLYTREKANLFAQERVEYLLLHSTAKNKRTIDNNETDLYITNFLIDKNSCKERFDFLLNPEVICLEDNKYLRRSTNTNRSLYTKIKNGFDQIRDRAKESANVVDALVLCGLSERLKDVKQTGQIPIFFDESGTFSKVIKLTNTEEYFCHRIDLNFGLYDFNIIQDDQFLKWYLILSGKIDLRDHFDNLAKEAFYSKLIYIINDKIDYNFTRKGKHISLAAKDIDDSINNFIRALLKERLLTGENIETVVKNLISTKFNISKTKVKYRNYIGIIEEKVKKFTLQIKPYLILVKAMNVLMSRELIKKNIKYYKNTLGFNASTVFSLSKFFIEEKELVEINRLIQKIFIDNDSTNTFMDAMEHIRNGIDSIVGESKNSEGLKKLTIGIAILWIFGEYKIIDELLNNLDYKYKNNNSLRCFHAAVISKSIYSFEDETKEIKRIKSIEQTISKPEGDKYGDFFGYQVRLIRAYVYFQIWEGLLGQKDGFFSKLKQPPSASKSNKIQKYLLIALEELEASIKWLEEGSRYLKTKSKRKYYLYIINNYIYYTTLACDDKKFSSLKDKVGILSDDTHTPSGLWQHIYDDTLALYNLREARIKSFEKKSSETVNDFLKKGKSRITNALKYVLREEEEKKYISLEEKIDGFFTDSYEVYK